MTVTELLAERKQLESVGGVSYVASLTETMGSSANVAAYAKIIGEKAVLRRLIQSANQMIAFAYGGGKSTEDILDDAEASIFKIAAGRIHSSYYPLKDVIKENIQAIERNQEYHESVTGVPSGFADLDKLTAGFQKSDLIIIAARPSMGKTALALNIAMNAAQKPHGIPVGFFSLEMSKEQLAMRLLCMDAPGGLTQNPFGIFKQAGMREAAQCGGIFNGCPHLYRR